MKYIKDGQEKNCSAEHIADILTEAGWVLESALEVAQKATETTEVIELIEVYDKETLMAIAEKMDIEIDKRWSAKKIRKIIDDYSA